ncbi:MAG: glycerophosphodiester phosphodiesterase family protein [Bacteroidota bacterium]|nr:glycerophosphodiester phosphodiesterase family protein [Bacteroidota bacterium]
MKQSTIVMAVLMACIQSVAGVKVIAHRGGSLLAPENTLAAFHNAIALKADYLELDMQLSSDDSIMIMHDATVDRTTTGTGMVRSMTYAQLRALDAGSKFGPSFAGEKIPTLSEVLAAAKGSVNNIKLFPEFKSSEANVVQLVVTMLQNWNMQSRAVPSSFDINQLTAVKALDASIQVQLYATASTATINQLKAAGGEWIGSDVTSQAVVDSAHSKGIMYNSWTINSASQMVPLIKLGVDGIITDDPKTLIAVSDTSAPSDVVLQSAAVSETKVTLSWSTATDIQSGIAGYEIYRGTSAAPTTLYATVGTVTQYVDQTYTENSTYHYRVKAKNSAGILSTNYSNELSALTLTDLTKPFVSFVTSRGDSGTVVVEFSERVDSVTALTKANYTINKSIVVVSGTLARDQKSVILATTKMNDTSYTLTVKNVKDRAVMPNVMITSNNTFVHKNSSSNVVAYYQLDSIGENGTDTLIYDATSNANNGIIKNGPVISEGLLGNALSFDGVNDYVQFNTSPSFDVSSAVSVSVWAKLAYLPSELPLAYGALFDSETDNYVLYEDKGNNQLRFKVSTSNGAARPAIPAADVKTGEWIHIVGVYDGTNAMIYLNGVLKGTLPLTGTVNAGQVAMLGKSSNSSPTYFKGSMDNIQVFNTALSQAEITDMYTSIKTAPLSTVGIGAVVEELQPKEFSLLQNFPNPFNPTTNITFGVPQNSIVKIVVYDVIGDEIATLVNENFAPGLYTAPFNAATFASGVYFYRMTSQPLHGEQKIFTSAKKLLLLK